MDDKELYHFGIPHGANGPGTGSGRYPWNPLLHLSKPKRNARTTKKKPRSKKEPSVFEKIKKNSELKKKQKLQAEAKAAKAAAAAKAKAIEDAKKAREESKKKALESGTYSDIAPYLKELSAKEINDAITRLDAEKRFMDKMSESKNDENARSQKEYETQRQNRKNRKQKFDDTINNVKDVVGYGRKGLEIYNDSAKLFNMIAGTNLPVLDEKAESHRTKVVNNIINSGDLDTVARNWDKLTLDEKDKALNGISLNREMDWLKTYGMNADDFEGMPANTIEQLLKTRTKRPKNSGNK